MRIELLDSAEKDLLDGFKFYESLSKGLGDYFLDSLFSDIESLYLYIPEIRVLSWGTIFLSIFTLIVLYN